MREFLQEETRARLSQPHRDRAERRARRASRSTPRVPGIVIGRQGADIEKLRQEVAPLLGLNVNNVKVNIAEIRKPELDALWSPKASRSSSSAA